MAYLATYILPFLNGVPSSTPEVIAAAIYAITLFVIFVQTDVRSVNPTLFFFRFRIARLKLNGDDSHANAICIDVIKPGDTVSCSSFGGATVVKKAPHSKLCA